MDNMNAPCGRSGITYTVLVLYLVTVLTIVFGEDELRAAPVDALAGLAFSLAEGTPPSAVERAA